MFFLFLLSFVYVVFCPSYKQSVVYPTEEDAHVATVADRLRGREEEEGIDWFQGKKTH